MEESKQILIAITELQANLKNMNNKMDDIGKISNLVIQTEQSTKSAHNRIDDVRKDIEKNVAAQKEETEKKLREAKEEREKEVTRIEKDLNEKIQAECKAREKMEGHITWLWRSIGLGGIGFAFWMLQQAFNFGG